MSQYESFRAEKIARNKALLRELQIDKAKSTVALTQAIERPQKRRKTDRFEQKPLRTSSRLAATPTRLSYDKDYIASQRSNNSVKTKQKQKPAIEEGPVAGPTIDEIKRRWSSWDIIAEPPTRDENGSFHFSSDPSFLPNKSPAEMVDEGCFGGSYFRPIYSSTLKYTIEGDWKELPSTWLESLNVNESLISQVYNPNINKYGVACGQSIEQWEANGWINHQFDIRGWFQWYTRYFLGRRCEDDNRQISRWRKCVGERGRWRRALLKKYQQAGIRSVNDEGIDETEGVSPAIHQTCLHWAWEIKQDVLDQWWDEN
jgi:hypothetical protein